ncbi:uncharacterized protein A1O5_02114 [Cladophialophora psammophila CBS 110553]|uniref:GED domain-containing protein n=1 Tax=Cladophialophora psammophila CBS 110553 TaxID=1182543 RepID=W9X5F5_9EURO|nr:uncharacterized protein A1O5_02114 [Cladophialophora psammophila CBS 110553]EXJ75418.1 hypothetical protein A1O5_02114 [Cladophialophora psammophila CBS 110553]
MTPKPASLNLEALGSPHQDRRQAYLSVVDQLRELGVGEDLSLPQSSGKSSLLEGLTGLPFPVASDLCTRHATQIVLRRTAASEAALHVSIIPGPSNINNADESARLGKFARSIKDGAFGEAEFARILDEASEVMGLPRAGAADLENLERRFSDNVLKVELAGPEHHHLSVVDVPGLFHNTTRYQKDEDRKIIHKLITGYISDPRTVILAVMDGSNNLAMQEVFERARGVDPRGYRTVGIITKCDLVQRGDEVGVIRLAQNTVEKLQHGWFAVRNRSPAEIKSGVSLKEHHAKEREFFTASPWSELHKDRVGIPALGTFLAQLLYEHIRREFPAVVVEIDNRCRRLRADIEDLGPPRQSTMERRQYLNGIASRYQKKVSDSLKGIYDAVLLPDHPLKLRMHVRNLSDGFEKEMSKQGHTRAFRNTNDKEDPMYQSENSEASTIYEWIRTSYLESRGCELPGCVNPALIENLFRQQTSKWQELAKKHLESVRSTIDSFLTAVLRLLIVDPTIQDRLQARLTPVFDESVTQAYRTLENVLGDERGGILQTVNHYYADNLAAARKERVILRLERLGIADGAFVQADLTALANAAHLGNEDQAVYDIHDILKAYYKVAIKRFMDNVVMAVVERWWLALGGFVGMFDGEFVGNLSDEDLASIAAENHSTTHARADLKEKLRRFEEAHRIARSI